MTHFPYAKRRIHGNYPLGARMLGICAGCRLEAHLTRTKNGWRCPHCDHTTKRLNPPNHANRRVPSSVTSEYAAGFSIRQIAAARKVAPSNVRERLIRAGIKLREPGDWRGKRA